MRLKLEDAATHKGWVSTLGLLAGTMHMRHFVASLGGEVRYDGGALQLGFLPLGCTMLLRTERAPGMDEALDGLRLRSLLTGG